MKYCKALCFSIMFSIVLLSCGKDNSFSVNKSINALQKEEWTISETPYSNEEITEIINNEFKDYFEVQIIESYITLLGPDTLPNDDPNWVPPRTVHFITFSNQKDAETYYYHFLEETKIEKSNVYIGIHEKTYVDTNLKEATKYINVEFTLI